MVMAHDTTGCGNAIFELQVYNFPPLEYMSMVQKEWLMGLCVGRKQSLGMSSSAIKKLWKSSIHLIRTVLRVPPFNICILMKSLLNINNILPFDSMTRLWSIANIP
jgi:hypothetical protein